MATSEEVAWAAGLFEGEGCFSLNTSGPFRPRATAGLSMTDEDVVRKFHSIVGFGSVSVQHRTGNKKTFWHWRTGGYKNVKRLVLLLWPHLCSRRRERAKEVLDKCARGHVRTPLALEVSRSADRELFHRLEEIEHLFMED